LTNGSLVQSILQLDSFRDGSSTVYSLVSNRSVVFPGDTAEGVSSIDLRAKIAIACITLAASKPVVLAQLPASQTPSFTAHSTLVLVPALVRTKSGSLVFTLSANDFALTDDGVPQKLTLEQDTGGEPLALVIAVEVGGAGARELDKLSALGPMLDSVIGNVPHKIAVVAFDSTPTLMQGFTSNTDTATAALQDLSSGDNGAAILDALGLSVDLLRKQPPPYRRAILLVSETVDRGSQLQLDDALRAVSDTNTAIYSIGFSTSKSEASHYTTTELPSKLVGLKGGGFGFVNPHPNPSGGCMSKNTAPDSPPPANGQTFDCLGQLLPPLALAKLAFIAASNGLRRNIPETVADLTGGEYFKLTNAKSLERSLERISNHIPNRYILSFQPQAPHPGLHVIGLRVRDDSALNVTARSSYWAEPETTSSDQPNHLP
jgi:VWFA-related protein